jgi:predicted RNA-binding Zn-ribbon protein involved in translation (DUF1610 family)
MSTIRQQKYIKSVEQFKCSSCGGELQVVNPRTNFIACQYCGTVQEAKTQDHKILLQLSKPSKFPPMRFIKLGMEAEFDGVKYKVIGRTRWRTQYKEWDAESGKYEDSTWQFDEWLLLSQYYSFVYLVEDREGFAMSYPFVPRHPNLPTQDGWINNFYSGDRTRVSEYGKATIIHFEGESTYQIEVGKEINFAEYKAGNTVFVVESHFYKDSTELQEIEFWREPALSYAQILQAFSQNPEVKRKKEKYTARKKTYQFFVRSFFMLAAACFVAFFLSFSAKKVLDVTYPIPYSFSNSSSDSMRLIATTERFTLDKQDEMIEFILSISSNGFRDGWAGIEICNAQDEVVNTMEGDFYDEGDEGLTSTSQVYKVDKTGEYYIKLYVEPTSWLSVYESGVRIEVERVWMLSRYYIIGFVIFLICGFIASVIIPSK